MEWISFISGSLMTAFAYALFTSDREEDEELEEMELDQGEQDDLVVNGHKTRNVVMSCQTCRKLKKHKEIEPNLFQCFKCKRHVDLRRVS